MSNADIPSHSFPSTDSIPTPHHTPLTSPSPYSNIIIPLTTPLPLINLNRLTSTSHIPAPIPSTAIIPIPMPSSPIPRHTRPRARRVLIPVPRGIILIMMVVLMVSAVVVIAVVA